MPPAVQQPHGINIPWVKKPKNAFLSTAIQPKYKNFPCNSSTNLNMHQTYHLALSELAYKYIQSILALISNKN